MSKIDNAYRMRYQRWIKYLKDSKLTEQQIKDRATKLTEQGRDPEF